MRFSTLGDGCWLFDFVGTRRSRSRPARVWRARILIATPHIAGRLVHAWIGSFRRTARTRLVRVQCARILIAAPHIAGRLVQAWIESFRRTTRSRLARARFPACGRSARLSGCRA